MKHNLPPKVLERPEAEIPASVVASEGRWEEVAAATGETAGPQSGCKIPELGFLQ